MSKPTQIEMDMAAARMLGYKSVSIHPDGSGACAYRRNMFIWKKFTLTNPADLLAAMTYLERDHGVVFCCRKDYHHGVDMFFAESQTMEVCDTNPVTRVGLAAMEVMK